MPLHADGMLGHSLAELEEKLSGPCRMFHEILRPCSGSQSWVSLQHWKASL